MFYPKLIFSLLLAFILTALSGGIYPNAASAQFWSQEERQLLPEEEAFQVSAYVDQSGLLKVNWSIAQDYYMYRDQFRIEANSPNAQIGSIEFPEGQIEDDPEFGQVEVYFFNAELSAPLAISSPTSGETVNEPQKIEFDLTLKGQGCNKPVGVCYPPMVRTLSLEVDPTAAISQESSLGKASNKDSIKTNTSKGFLSYMLSALIAGLLLSFTPCVLPMVPILAGVIAGQENPSRLLSGWLAICYVLGTVVTYIAAGALAGATGAQLQAYFQNVWVLSGIAALLVILAASLFGWFKIQLPSNIQTKLNNTSVSSKSAAWSSFSLGLISALVVGACVSPILIVTLGAAITQGDPLLGAAIMGSMAVGMGALLILFGFGAGWILPKAGPWMNHIQIVFGFMVLGVAIYLLSGLAFIPSLYLWAGLLLCSGYYIWSVAQEVQASGSNPLISSSIYAIATAVLLWGGMALIGGTLKGDDILRPLQKLGVNTSSASDPISDRSKLPFARTNNLADAQKYLNDAKQAGKPALIDFYADWCLDCKRMHRTTFKEAAVKDALSNWTLIEIDVTENSELSKQAKQFFEVFGPPATLFFATNGQEQKSLRQYGYLDKESFLNLVKKTSQ